MVFAAPESFLSVHRWKPFYPEIIIHVIDRTDKIGEMLFRPRLSLALPHGSDERLVQDFTIFSDWGKRYPQTGELVLIHTPFRKTEKPHERRNRVQWGTEGLPNTGRNVQANFATGPPTLLSYTRAILPGPVAQSTCGVGLCQSR